MTRVLKFAVAAAACASIGACASAGKLNPFHKDAPKIAAAKGERIPVLAYDTTVKPAEALQGVGYQLPEPQAVTAWPLPGGDASQSMDNVQAAPNFQIAWRRGVGAGSSRKREVTAPPVAVDGRIFTMDGAADVVATNAKTGAHAWRVNLAPKSKRDREAFGGGLAVSEGKLYVTSGYRFIAAVDPNTGKLLWRTMLNSPVHTAPTVSGGKVYAIDVDNQIMAFDINTGEQSWAYQAIVEPARILKASSPAIVGEQIVAPFSSGELVALSAANGTTLWDETLTRSTRTNALSEIRDIPGRPAIYRGDVYAASQSGVFAAVDLRNGNARWELPVASVNSPWPAGDVVFVVSKAGEVIAANRENGQVYWLADLNKNRTRKEGRFMRMGGHLIHPIWTGPLLAGDRLILVNDWGEAVALDAKSGEIKKTIRINDPSYITPIAYDGMIYVMTDKAELVAIR
jgi:outer membrane protein assembly factor BamB